MITGSLIFR